MLILKRARKAVQDSAVAKESARKVQDKLEQLDRKLKEISKDLRQSCEGKEHCATAAGTKR